MIALEFGLKKKKKTTMTKKIEMIGKGDRRNRIWCVCDIQIGWWVFVLQ